MTKTDPALRGLTRREKDQLASRAIAAREAKRAENARARQRRKARGEVRLDRWIHADWMSDIRRLLSAYEAARRDGLALQITLLPHRQSEDGAYLIMDDIPGSVSPEGQASPEPDLRERFHHPDHTPALRQIITEIVAATGPLPRDSLELQVARHHGFTSTGTRIRNRIATCLDCIDLHDEDGRAFAWTKDAHALRAAWRGRGGRDVADISRHEWASLIDIHADRIGATDDPILELARRAGIKSLSAPTRRCLTTHYEWWQANPPLPLEEPAVL